jgi:ligand-binding sensor domain-containing protein
MYRLTQIALIFFAATTLLACEGLSQTEEEPIEEETLKMGKKVSELYDQVWAIFQDSKGNYWFGSNGHGLYHYDEKQLKQLTTIDGLVDNTIRGIQEDSIGNLYIETPSGISKYDGAAFTTLQKADSTENEWKLLPNDLWFGYNANDLYRYDGELLHELELPRKDLNKAFGIETKGVPFESNNYSPYAVYGVNKDSDGNMWFGTSTAGAYRYDGKELLWIGEKELSTLPDGRVPGVRSMLQDKDGYFWLSNFYSKYKIDPDLPKGYEKLKAADYPEGVSTDKIRYFNSGLVDTEGNLWMTTYGGGIWKYDGKTLSNMELRNDKEDLLIICIYQDSKGTIWLGTHNDGVYKQFGDTFEKFELNK